jgi:hypothetical protein
MEDHERRIAQLEEDSRDYASTLGDLQTVIMGPPPNRNNGIRGDLAELKKAFYTYKEECLEEEGNVKSVSIQASAQERAARRQSTAMIVCQALTLLGVIIVALK